MRPIRFYVVGPSISLLCLTIGLQSPLVATEKSYATASRLTFSSDVGPLLLKKCVQCHRAGGIASQIDFTSYKAAKPWAAAMKQAVTTRAMPPWSADPLRSVKFRNDARLSGREIAMVTAWVDAGAPLGVGSGTLDVPSLTGGWEHPQGRKPDLVLSTDHDMQIPATGDVPYLRFLVKLPLDQDRWISASQVRPGNAAVVHHMAMTEVQLDPGVTPSDIQATDTLSHMMGMSVANSGLHPVITDPSNRTVFDMLGMYTPGSTLETYPDDSGKLLKGGSNVYINFNMHYASNGTATTDRTQVAFWFRATPPKHQIYRVPMAYETVLAEGKELLTDSPGIKAEGTLFALPPIPPRAKAYELTSVTALTRSTIVYQLQPHAHLRGKDFSYTAIYPDGQEKVLLSVPQYDFRWQLAYDLQNPLNLPAGSKLVIVGHYDNSAENRFNPAPAKPVFFRAMNMSTDEMFSPFVQYSVGEDADLPVVETVGCLVAGGKLNAWNLTKATKAVPATQSTSSVEVQKAALTAPGSKHFHLIGLGPFDANKRIGERVAVRGVLISGDESRINVTSLQSLSSGACASR